MDNETKMMLNTILKEMGRMEERINEKFDKIESHLEIIQREIETVSWKGNRL